PHALDQVQGVAVGPDGRGSFGSAQDVWDRRDGFAGFEQVVADLGWGRAESAQARGCVGVDAPTPVRWYVVEERVAHQSMAEPVAGGGPFDDVRTKGCVEMVEGVSFVLESTH